MGSTVIRTRRFATSAARARDATALWAVLSDSIDGLNAPLIIDESATGAAVAAALEQPLGAADEDDIVLLTFAGHETADHRLVLHDTDTANILGTTIDMGTLAERFRQSRARETHRTKLNS